jgi:spermidine/putrescine transport system permease protein
MNPAYSRNGKRGLWTVFWMLVLFLYAPIVVLIVFSFNARELVSFPWEGFTTRWYGEFVSNPELLAALKTSAWVAILVSIVTTALSIPSAIALVRRTFIGKGPISGVMLAPLVIPLVVLGTALLILFNAIGIPASPFSIAIGHIVIALPFAILTLVPRLERIPVALEEASRDLGGSWWQTFSQITFPLLLPAVFSAFLISFVISFDEVVIASFVSGEQVTFPVYLYSQIRLPRNLPQVIAVAVVVMAISVIVMVALETARRITDRKLEQSNVGQEEEVAVT